MVVFKEGDQIYHSKVLSFYRKQPFDLVATYQKPSLLPYPTPAIGTFSVRDVKPTESGEASKIKVKVRMNIHGIFFIKTASLIEKLPAVTEEEVMETEKPANVGGNGESSDVSQGECVCVCGSAIYLSVMYRFRGATETCSKSRSTNGGCSRYCMLQEQIEMFLTYTLSLSVRRAN